MENINDLAELKEKKKNWYSFMVWMTILAAVFAFFTACSLLDTTLVCKTSAMCPNLYWGLGGFIVSGILALVGFSGWYKVKNQVFLIEFSEAIDNNLETTELKGHLEYYYETGYEGSGWAFHEEDKVGYDGLHVLETGDYLEIQDKDSGETVWSGEVTVYPKIEIRDLSEYGGPKDIECEVYYLKGEGLNFTNDYDRFFKTKYPAVLIKNKGGNSDKN